MAQQDTFATYIQREREEVQKARDDLLAKRRDIDEQLQGLDRRWEAAEAYEAVLRGKPMPQARAPRAPSAGRGKRGERRGRVIGTHQPTPRWPHRRPDQPEPARYRQKGQTGDRQPPRQHEERGSAPSRTAARLLRRPCRKGHIIRLPVTVWSRSRYFLMVLAKDADAHTHVYKVCA
jgi:hypothetical protein